MQLLYNETATFVKVSSSGYSNNKTVVSRDDVPVIFLQDTGFDHLNSQDAINADAIAYPDPFCDFVVENHYRLEGMYLLAPMFDASDDEGWYKVVKVKVNRDHLLGNEIDNVQLFLKKSKKVPGVS